MSVSDSQRTENRKATLLAMRQALGERRFTETAFDKDEAGFPEILPTTWRELQDDGLVDDRWSTMGAAAFRLTSYGWLRAVILSGEVNSQDLRERCIKLIKALKNVAKGRESHYDKFVSLNVLSSATGLAQGWIYNAVSSGLLGVVFPNDKWDAHMDAKGSGLVRVSPTFGLNHLDDGE